MGSTGARMEHTKEVHVTLAGKLISGHRLRSQVLLGQMDIGKIGYEDGRRM
jgi:hypothetical protein